MGSFPFYTRFARSIFSFSPLLASLAPEQVQYSICRLLAKAAGGISVVGDPDQAICASLGLLDDQSYRFGPLWRLIRDPDGWRDAEVGNIKAMLKDFKGCQTILLEDNYRSTGAILSASHTVVAQDKSRIAKGLRVRPLFSPSRIASLD